MIVPMKPIEVKEYFRDSLMALLITEFVMGTENKVQASNPDGEHVISECWLKHKLSDI